MARVGFRCIVIACVAMMLSSCGSLGGSAGEFQTVYYSVSNVSPGNIDADVAKHSATDSAQFFGTSDSVSIPAADEVTVTLKSTLYPNVDASKASDIMIHSATVSYQPMSTASPAIPTQYQAMSLPITPGASTAVLVRVVPQEIKESLLPSIKATGAIYGYHVTIKFDLEEIKTAARGTADAQLDVRISDFVDK